MMYEDHQGMFYKSSEEEGEYEEEESEIDIKEDNYDFDDQF